MYYAVCSWIPLSRQTNRKLTMTYRKITIVLIFAWITVCAGLTGCGKKTPAQLSRETRLEQSPQYQDGKFQNPIFAPVMASGSFWKYVKKRVMVPRVDPEPPEGVIPVTPIIKKEWAAPEKSRLSFAWLGHASVLIAMGGKTILVDPVLEERCSPFSWIGPKRFHPSPVAANGLPHIDVVLITHDHYDHLEESTMRYLADKAGLFAVPLGIGALLEEWQIPHEKIVELDWWESHDAGPLRLTAVPGVHYAKRGLFDGDQRLWCAWTVHGESRRIFISGDSGYYDGFKTVGRRLGPFDLTFLKVGAYDDLWKQIHMLPEEAVQQHLDLQGNIMVPLHWVTFDLAMHPWYEPADRALESSNAKGVTLLTPPIGAVVDLDRLPKENRWWQQLK